MKKVLAINTQRRARPAKKQRVAQTATTTGETIPLSENDNKVPCIQATNVAISPAGADRQNSTIKAKKRNISCPVSLDSNRGITIKKRRQKLSDSVANSVSKKSTAKSRTSSKEKPGTLLTTGKQEAVKLVEDLTPPLSNLSSKKKPRRTPEISQKSTPRRRRSLIKRSLRAKLTKAISIDQKESLKTEVRRLTTTDGFWSSKPPSRSDSPLSETLEPPSQTQATVQKKSSRTSTPDITPASKKRKSTTNESKMSAEKNKATASKSNIPISELRRLKTTVGFLFSNVTLTSSRSSSRDASPSSIQTQDKSVRLTTKPSSSSNEDKHFVKKTNITDQDAASASADQVMGKPRKNRKKFLDTVEKVAENQFEISEIQLDLNTTTDSVLKTERPLSKFKKKMESELSGQSAKGKKQKIPASQFRRGKTLSLIQRSSRFKRLNSTSRLPNSLGEDSNPDHMHSTSPGITGGKQRKSLNRNRGTGKQLPQKKTILGPKRVKGRFSNPNSLIMQGTSEIITEGDSNLQFVTEEIPLVDSVSAKSPRTAEFVLSDLLSSKELKRLNTTAGFWASSPDIGTVLGNQRRLREADSTVVKSNSHHLKPVQVMEVSSPLSECSKIPAKPQKIMASHRKHRKRRLQALTDSLRKSRGQLNDQHEFNTKHEQLTSDLQTFPCAQPRSDDSGEPNDSVLSTPPSHVARKCNSDKLSLRGRRRKRSTFQSCLPSTSQQTDTSVTSELFEHNNITETKSSGTDTSVCDTVSLEKPVIKTWRRGSQKINSGDIRKKSADGKIKTRQRRKLSSAQTQSSDFLKNMTPDRDNYFLTTSLTTENKNEKHCQDDKGSYLESDIGSSVEADMILNEFGAEAPKSLFDEIKVSKRGTDVEKPQRCFSSVVTGKLDSDPSERNDILLMQYSGHKKDNLFESLQYNLLVPLTPSADYPSSEEANKTCQDSSDKTRNKIELDDICESAMEGAVKSMSVLESKFKNDLKVEASAEKIDERGSQSADRGGEIVSCIVQEESITHKKAELITIETKAEPVILETEAEPVIFETQAKSVVLEMQAEHVIETQAEPIATETQAESITLKMQTEPVSLETQTAPITFETQAGRIIIETKEPVTTETHALFTTLQKGHIASDFAAENSEIGTVEENAIANIVTAGPEIFMKPNSCDIKNLLPSEEIIDESQLNDSSVSGFTTSELVNLSAKEENSSDEVKLNNSVNTSSKEEVTPEESVLNNNSDSLNSSPGEEIAPEDSVLNNTCVGVKSSSKEEITIKESMLKCSSVNSIPKEEINSQEPMLNKSSDSLNTSSKEESTREESALTNTSDSDMTTFESVTFSFSEEVSLDKPASVRIENLLKEDLNSTGSKPSFASNYSHSPVTITRETERGNMEGVLDETNVIVQKKLTCEMKALHSQIGQEITAKEEENASPYMGNENSAFSLNLSYIEFTQTSVPSGVAVSLTPSTSDLTTSLTPGSSGVAASITPGSSSVAATFTPGFSESHINGTSGNFTVLGSFQTSSANYDSVSQTTDDSSACTTTISLDSTCDNKHEVTKTNSEIITYDTKDNDLISSKNIYTTDLASVVSTVGQVDSVTELSEDLLHKEAKAIDTVIPDAANIFQKSRRRRRSHTKRFVRRKIHKNLSAVMTPTGFSSEISQIFSGILGTVPEVMHDNDAENQNTEAQESKQPVRKVRKKRRNAWQRGVLRKVKYLPRKFQKQGWPVNVSAESFAANAGDTPPLAVSSEVKPTTVDHEVGTSTGSGLLAEFSPKVKKSLTNVLKKLQTNANLANAILNARTHKGRYLRTKSPNEKGITIRRRQHRVNLAEENISQRGLANDPVGALQIEIPGESVHVKRRPGRPRKLSADSLPKLTSNRILPSLRPGTPRNKTPPALSPQTYQPSEFLGTDYQAETAVRVSETVADTYDFEIIHTPSPVTENAQGIPHFVETSKGVNFKNAQNFSCFVEVTSDLSHFTDNVNDALHVSENAEDPNHVQENVLETSFTKKNVSIYSHISENSCLMSDATRVPDKVLKEAQSNLHATSQSLHDIDVSKNAQDVDFVSESVDETDLHLYLSGVSDEEQSPMKESHPVSAACIPTNSSLYRSEYVNCGMHEATRDNSVVKQIEEMQKSVTITGKEHRKPGRPKMKGRRGRPPGIPMTDEERRKKVNLLKHSHNEDEGVRFPRTGAHSVLTLDTSAASSIYSPAAKFSLRKKSTRSPLEMLEMKRKIEEARYDLEQEKRQARLIHLREMRSARESGDGFSDEGEAVPGTDNIMVCSVVLSDFVKKLQLDNIEFSSDQDNQERNVEECDDQSPVYDTYDDDDDENWCADLEEHNNEGWNDERPYIPRIKLKRVVNKVKPSQVKGVKKPQPAKNSQHQPIKLVIKTEPVTDHSELILANKSGSFMDQAKTNRSGFEDSYVNFIKGKSKSLLEKTGSPRKMFMTKSNQVDVGSHRNTSDLGGGVEILSLPTSGARNSSFAVNDKSSTSSGYFSQCISVPVVSPTDVNGTPTTNDDMTLPEPSRKDKRLSSGEDEDDDILILDLEDGILEQNEGNLSELGNFDASTNPDIHPCQIMTAESTGPQIPQDRSISIDGGVHVRTHRSLSNDEMGLMLASYNSEKDQLLEICSYNEKESSTSVAGIKQNETLVNNQETGTSQALITSPGMDDHQKSNENVSDTASVKAAVGDTSEVLQAEVLAVTDNTAHSFQQNETEPAMQEVNWVTSREEAHGNSQWLEKSNMLNLESVMATADKAQGECEPAVADNNNVMLTFHTPFKASVPLKRTSVLNENGKSPKHSTHPGAESEEWIVKVISQSDKFPSAKYSCKRCSFTTAVKLTIKSHIYSHIPGVQFRCAYCESEFSTMAATSTHLKNTHSMNEAKLLINRQVDERNFYDREARAVLSEESGQHSPAHASGTSTNSGQSPPVIISVVVSGNVGSSRGGRSAPARRFVCTHCGFSTNVREDAEHHVLDLHPSQSLYACILCSENIYYTENEIKGHCATVHPSRNHPYRKLPDFYDAEQLSLIEKAASQDDRENIFERMSSIFQDDAQPGAVAIDHRQKAKDYLFLQEGWREKTKVEADSTTTEEQSTPLSPAVEENDEGSLPTDGRENEVCDPQNLSSQSTDVVTDTDISGVTEAVKGDTAITSSAGASVNIPCMLSQETVSDFSFDVQNEEIELGQGAIESELLDQTCHSVQSVRISGEGHNSAMSPSDIIEESEEDGGGMGLKIIEVVSLSGQCQDLEDEQAAEDLADEQLTGDLANEQTIEEQTDPEQTEAGVSNDTNQVLSSESCPETSPEFQLFDASEHSTTLLNQPNPQREIEAQFAKDKVEKAIHSAEVVPPPTVTTASSSATAVTSPAATVSSAVSPSLVGGLPLSYKCNACRVHTPYLLMMVKHLKAKHPNMRCFACPYCKSANSFASQKQLRHHVKQCHSDKFGRNEIALSDDAKKFVEAMVLPLGPECIRVGSRIVLEEDIHTCTYCQVKMTSLASVYDHLKSKHSELFEFVCPVCQNFKNKVLTEISDHCLKNHKVSLDTDKVHVSVPKNLFTALTCISKSGKYIEKTLDAVAEGGLKTTLQGPSNSCSTGSQQAVKGQSAPAHGKKARVSTTEQSKLGKIAAIPASAIHGLVPVSQTAQPLFAIPLVPASIASINSVSTHRPVFAISSALFDTSTLTTPTVMATASQPIPVIQNAAVASFLSPQPQKVHTNNQQASKQQATLQAQSKQREKPSPATKNLTVLNVPTIKSRTSSLASKSTGARRTDDSTSLDATLENVSASGGTITPGTSQTNTTASAGASSSLDFIPDDEPNPDAFKIFNLRPTGPLMSPSPAPPIIPAGVQSVFPPVSTPMASEYIQGPIAGFPPAMVISPHLLPLSYPFSQHQPLVHRMLAPKHSTPWGSSGSMHPQPLHSSPSTSTAAAMAPIRSSILAPDAAATTMLLKKQQQRELTLLKKQQHMSQMHFQPQQHHLRQKHPPIAPRVHPAHQQPPSLSGQVYQPQTSPLSFDPQQLPPGPSSLAHSTLFSSPPPSSTSFLTTGAQLSPVHPSSPARPTKGAHKRSSSLYQCPYCPVTVTLKALDVASHIQQHHPGRQVTFKKVV